MLHSLPTGGRCATSQLVTLVWSKQQPAGWSKQVIHNFFKLHYHFILRAYKWLHITNMFYAKYWPIYLTLNELNIIGTSLKNPASVSQIKCHKKGRIILNRIKSIEMVRAPVSQQWQTSSERSSSHCFYQSDWIKQLLWRFDSPLTLAAPSFPPVYEPLV